MKIVVVGGTGTIGKFVVEALKKEHDVIPVGARGGAHQVDIEEASSIKAMFEKIGRIDALVAAVGKVHFGDFAKLTEKDVAIGWRSKVMGQVNLVLIGKDHMNDGGSFTLTTGVLAHDPIVAGTCASMANAAIEGFTIGAAIEMPRGIRINVVSPGLLTESLAKYGPYFPGHETVDGARVAKAYVKSVLGRQNGQVYRVL